MEGGRFRLGVMWIPFQQTEEFAQKFQGQRDGLFTSGLLQTAFLFSSISAVLSAIVKTLLLPLH